MSASYWTEAIGWFSGLVLLATISRQVFTQWRTRSVEGVSHWLFAGQLLASCGFLVYSVLVGNWVFVATNTLMVIASIAGQIIYWTNQSREQTTPAAVQRVPR